MTCEIQTCQQPPKPTKAKPRKPAKEAKTRRKNQPKETKGKQRKAPKKPGKAAKRRRNDPEDADRIVLGLWTLASLKFLIRPVLRGQLIRGGRKSTIRSMGPKSFSPNDKRGRNQTQGNKDTKNPRKRAPKKRQQKETLANPQAPGGFIRPVASTS